MSKKVGTGEDEWIVQRDPPHRRKYIMGYYVENIQYALTSIEDTKCVFEATQYLAFY